MRQDAVGRTIELVAILTFVIRSYLTFVIPAKAGIHLLTSLNRVHLEMDSRVRGNDEVG